MNTKFFRFFILALSLALIISFWSKAEAVSYPLAFGGKNSFSIYCANGTLLVVIGTKGGKFLLTPASRQFAWRQTFGTFWVLGTYLPGGKCNCPYGDCETSPMSAKGTIIMMGSSPQIP